VVEDPLEEEVCYGKLQAKLECFRVPSPKPGAQSIFGPGYIPQVKVVLKRIAGDRTIRIQAYDYKRDIVGNLDAHTSAALAPILDSQLKIRTDCRIPARPKRDDEVPGQDISRAYDLDLALYGPLKCVKTVGKHLLQQRLTLRSPTMVDKGIRVVNPHAQSYKPPPPQIKSQADSQYQRPAAPPRTVEEVRNEVMSLFDSLAKKEDLSELDPDPRVLTPLLKHQKQGLHFMTMRERPRDKQEETMSNSLWKVKIGNNGEKAFYNFVTGHVQQHAPPDTLGGILADMMGLGKTLSILSLVINSFPDAEEWSKQAPVQPHIPPQRKGKSGHLQASHSLGLTQLVRNTKATLLVCPLSTVTNWEEQIKQHIQPGTLNYHIYHGANRIKDIDKLVDFDLVITTYGSVSSELSARSKGKNGTYPLEQIGWFRIVLDEAHMIRDHTTLQFKAMCRLQANRRWAVTGTPVQNRLDDLGALLAFLRLKPFDDRNKFLRYLVEPFKACDPEIVPKLRILVDSVTLRRLKDKIDLPPRVDHVFKLSFTAEERGIYDLFARNAQDRMKVLAGPDFEKALGGSTYAHILKSILRLRLLCAHGKDLLNDEDMEALQGMTADMAIDLDSDDEGDKPQLSERKAYEMFELMQETNSDDCIDCGKKLSGNDDAANLESEGQEDILGYMTPCFHIVCSSCVKSFKDRALQRIHQGEVYGPCPFCEALVKPSYVEIRRAEADVEHENPVKGKKGKRSFENYSGPHTKTRALLDDLLNSEADTAAYPEEPPYKSVVFSAWTSHLDLIELALDSVGIKYTRLDGKMSRTARTKAMDRFREDPSVHVIIVSIMAGGLGLNLTTANNVYVMEPQYNPAAEAQAIDRIHRLGQKRPVRTVRYIMENSIEEKMVEIQEKKMKLASLSVDGRDKAPDFGEAAKHQLLALRSLFR
jgi:SNF2 family DNA or RNA helicase